MTRSDLEKRRAFENPMNDGGAGDSHDSEVFDDSAGFDIGDLSGNVMFARSMGNASRMLADTDRPPSADLVQPGGVGTADDATEEGSSEIMVEEQEATAAGAVAATSDDLSVPSRIFKPMKSMHLANVFTITAQQASYSKSMGTKLCKLAACVSLFLLQLIAISSVHLGVSIPNCGQSSHCAHAGSYCCPR
jgi:hypothetical protein